VAIYHLHMQTISRADGRSAVAAAAYRAASRLTAADGRVFDFRRKQGVVAQQIFVPEGSPPIDRQNLWLMAEKTEKRKNSTLAREMDVAIPVELTQQERFKLTAKFCHWLAQEYQVAVDCCMHRKDKNDTQENPHLHVMFTTRHYMPEGTLGTKTRELDDLKTRKAHLLRIRGKWADFCNEYLQFYGEIIDHRSFKDQGIDLLPQIHVGSAATTMARRGLETERGALNQEIQKNNSEILQLQQEIENVRCLENGSGRECPPGVREYETDDSELSEEIGAGGSRQRLGQGLDIDGHGTQGVAGSKSPTPENGQGRNTAIAIDTEAGGTSGNSGARPCPAEDGCPASATHKNRIEQVAELETLAHCCASVSREIHDDIHVLVEAANLRCLERGSGTTPRVVEDGRSASAAHANRDERVATLEALAQSCVSVSREIHEDIHVLVDVANLRCLENGIREHRFQRLKARCIECMMERGNITREIFNVVGRVNAQAVHQALSLLPQPSSRLITIGEKAKNIIAVSQDIQQGIQAVTDRITTQYIQDYLKKIHFKQLKTSCLNIDVECGLIVREIFETTDRLDAQFIAQWLAQRSTANPINTPRIPEPNPPRSLGILNTNSAEAQPRLQIYSNGVIRVNLDAPESFEPDSAEDAPDNIEDTAIDNVHSNFTQ